MSAEEEQAPRSTSTPRGLKSEASMNAVGYLIIILMLPLLIPLAPFLAIAWLLGLADE